MPGAAAAAGAPTFVPTTGDRSAPSAPPPAAAHARPPRLWLASVAHALHSLCIFFLAGIPGVAYVIADDAAEPPHTSWYRFRTGLQRWLISALLFCGYTSQLLAALVAPVSTLLVIPALSQPWYRLRHGTQAEVADPAVSLVLSAINLFTNALANAFLLVRFSVADRHIWKFAIRISLFLWIVNLGFAIANLAVFAGGAYRNHSKYEYLEGFWCAVFSCVAAGTVTFLLVLHYIVRFGVMAYHIQQQAMRAAPGTGNRAANNRAPQTSADTHEGDGADNQTDLEAEARSVWHRLSHITRRHVRHHLRHVQQKSMTKWEIQQRERDARLSTEGRTFLISQAALFFSLGIFGFMFSRLEHWAFYDGVYFFLVVTLTVGYGTPSPTTTASKVLLLPAALASTMLLYNQIGTIVGVLQRLNTNRRDKWRHTFELQVERDQDALLRKIVMGQQVPELQLRENVPSPDVHYMDWLQEIWEHWHARQGQAESGQAGTAASSSGPSPPASGTEADHGTALQRARGIFSTALHDQLPRDGGEELMQLEIRRLNLLTERENRELASTDLAFSIVLMASFLIIGAAIFQGTESWSYGNALYFSYISVLTIGLGDMHPTTAAGRVIWLIYALTAVPIVTSFVVQTIANLVHTGAQRIAATQRFRAVPVLSQADAPPPKPPVSSRGLLLTRFHHQLTTELERLFGPRDITLEPRPADDDDDNLNDLDLDRPAAGGDSSSQADVDTDAPAPLRDPEMADLEALPTPELHADPPLSQPTQRQTMAAGSPGSGQDKLSPACPREGTGGGEGNASGSRSAGGSPPTLNSVPWSNDRARRDPDRPEPSSAKRAERAERTEAVEPAAPGEEQDSTTPASVDLGSFDALAKLVSTQRILLEDMMDTMYAMEGLVRNLLLRTLPHGSEAWTLLRADSALHHRAICMLDHLAEEVQDGGLVLPPHREGKEETRGGGAMPQASTRAGSASSGPARAYGSEAEEKLAQTYHRLKLLARAQAEIEGEPTLRHIHRFREAAARMTVFGEEMDRAMDAECALLVQARVQAKASATTTRRRAAPSADPNESEKQESAQRTEQLVQQERESIRQSYHLLHQRHREHVASYAQLRYPWAAHLWDDETDHHHHDTAPDPLVLDRPSAQSPSPSLTSEGEKRWLGHEP